MKALHCPDCGETLHIATDRAERIVRGTTPGEHMAETGHTDPRHPVDGLPQYRAEWLASN